MLSEYSLAIHPLARIQVTQSYNQIPSSNERSKTSKRATAIRHADASDKEEKDANGVLEESSPSTGGNFRDKAVPLKCRAYLAGAEPAPN